MSPCCTYNKCAAVFFFNVNTFRKAFPGSLRNFQTASVLSSALEVQTEQTKLFDLPVPKVTKERNVPIDLPMQRTLADFHQSLLTVKVNIPYCCVFIRQTDFLSNPFALIIIISRQHICLSNVRQNIFFSELSTMIAHMNIHTGVKSYSCPICNRKFFFPELRTVEAHIRSHIEKPHSYRIYNRNFPQLSNMEAHKKIHTGEKLYSCQTCNRSFSQSWLRSRHMRTHTGEKSHSYQKCGRSFVNYAI
ncbi:zinc finger protein [Loa loa]|uniref:Zinc finger protein n=1 Tax=Loa loa TaxID=7209 RepID=A0A1S0TIR6_LOALO|nr:zinc finger protein [Loa loa]EFO14699.1 zinc finger protein [Loa loa]